MGNTADYFKAYRALWTDYSKEQERHEVAMEGAETDEDRASEHARHAEGLRKARDKSTGPLLDALQRMRGRAEGLRTVEAPTEEQLRILLALYLMEKPSSETLRQAAEHVKGNALALEAVHDIASRRKRPIHPPVLSPRGKADETLEALRLLANALMRRDKAAAKEDPRLFRDVRAFADAHGIDTEGLVLLD